MSETKRPVGRPHELTPEIREKALLYLLDGFKEAGDTVPTVEGLACFIGKSRRVVYKWAGEDEEFMHIVDGVMTAQGKLLINGGLLGDYNPTITKLLLTKHGYSDKVENNHTSSDGSMTPQAAMSPEQFAELARAVADKV